MARHLRRRGLLRADEDGADPDVPGDPESNLAASAVSGRTPPAGPQWVTGLAPLPPHPLAYDKHLCASLDGFTLHAATRAGAMDPVGREALLCYVLRPPIAQERLDAGVLGAGSPWRPCITPEPDARAPEGEPEQTEPTKRPFRKGHGGGYRPWAELLARIFAVDVLTCPRCHRRMRLLAVIKEPANVARYLASVGEATEVPRRSPGRGPPYWKSRVLRRHVLDDDEGGGRNGRRAGEVA